MIADDAVNLRRYRAERDGAHARRRIAEITADIERDRHLPKITTGDLFSAPAPAPRRPALRVVKGQET